MKVDFFTEEDFRRELYMQRADDTSFLKMADIANKKIEKYGLVIHGKYTPGAGSMTWTILEGAVDEGYLVNIKPLKTCEHTDVKEVRFADSYGWKCSCGLRMKPTKWEVFDGKP